MLARMWKKGNSCTVLVGKYTGRAIKENSMKFPLKKKKYYMDLVISLLGIYTKELESVSRRDICSPVFTAALFTVAKMWKILRVHPSMKKLN